MQQQKYNPWIYITETTTDITLSPPVSIDYAENPEPVLQKTEYAVAEIQPWTYITEIAIDITLSPLSIDYAENINASFSFECGVSSLFYACLFFKRVFFLHGR